MSETAAERITLRTTPAEREAIQAVVALSRRRGFEYSESQALHWLIGKGIRLGLADELESMELGDVRE
jgi:hypothetical protein